MWRKNFHLFDWPLFFVGQWLQIIFLNLNLLPDTKILNTIEQNHYLNRPLLIDICNESTMPPFRYSGLCWNVVTVCQQGCLHTIEANPKAMEIIQLEGWGSWTKETIRIFRQFALVASRCTHMRDFTNWITDGFLLRICLVAR